MPRPHVGTRASSFWTDQKVSEALEALRASYTLDEAAQRIGVTVPALQSMCTQRRAALGGTAASFLRTSAAEKRDPMREAREVAERVVQRSAGERAPSQLVSAPSVHNCSVRRRAFSVERILVLPDTHRPFHSEQAWEAAMRAGRQFKPDRVIHLGDLWDFYAISFHPKSPERRSNLEAEVKSGCEALDEMASLGASRLDITLGNHCHRWSRYLAQNAPEMFNFLRFEEAVRFKERGWHVTPYREHLTVGKMHFTHEVGFCGKLAHRQSRMEFEGNVVIGHTHVLASEFKGTILDSSHVGISLGWLGDKKAIDYTHKAKAAAWQHGFGLAYHEPNGNVHVLPTPIIDGRCIVEGHLVEAPEYRRQAA